MKSKVLINLFDVHNESAWLAIDKIKPTNVIYIVDNKLEERYKEIIKYETKKYSNIAFESYVVDKGNIDKIVEILKNQEATNTTINLTGGERINSLMLLNLGILKGFNLIYIDVLKKNYYEFGDKISKNNYIFKDINLEDIVSIAGTDIITDSTNLSAKSEIIDIVKQIYNNLDTWYKYKVKLYDSNIFIHDCSDTNRIIINLSNVSEEEKIILIQSLKYLEKLGCITYQKNNEQIKVDFIKEIIKSFIFKSGTWLEVLTEMIIKQITEVDEVKSGVVFLWNESRRRVRNELDVLAVKDSILICISCKDSEKYDEDALNELDVYSKRLGGNRAKKILVATKKPSKECVVERAKAMNINLVILSKDIKKFREELKNIINK